MSRLEPSSLVCLLLMFRVLKSASSGFLDQWLRSRAFPCVRVKLRGLRGAIRVAEQTAFDSQKPFLGVIAQNNLLMAESCGLSGGAFFL